MKKYGDIPEYILAYIDYLSHLNGKCVNVVMKKECTDSEINGVKVFISVLGWRCGVLIQAITPFLSASSLAAEDNNTRVLFERVLTSGSLSPEKSG